MSTVIGSKEETDVLPNQDTNETRSGITSSDSGYVSNKNYLKIVKAIYPFKGANNDELCFQKDDLIILTQTPEGGWYEGTHLAKRITGWFPAGYVTPLHPDHAHSLLDQQFIDTFNKDHNLQSNRASVFSDLIETEKNYVAELQNVLQTYLLPLQKSQILSKEETELTVECYKTVIETHSKFCGALEAFREENKDLRIGGCFMSHATAIKEVHFNYCSIHPKFVHLIELQTEKVCNLLKETLGNQPNTTNYLILITSGLSLTFRHLDKYPSYLQELQRYTNDAHPDRGDIQRASFIFRELVTSCLQLRRQKEMELEVMLGNVRNWPTSTDPIESLGSVCHMGPVTVLQSPQSSETVKKDRYLVLFPACLVLLSVSDEMTSFVYEDKLLLMNVTLPRLPDIQSTKTTFHLLVADPNSEDTGKYVLSCINPEDIRKWISMMHKCKSKLESKGLETPLKEIRASPIHHAIASESPMTPVHMENNRSKYWAWKSLLPHPPIRISGSSSDFDGSSTLSRDALSKINLEGDVSQANDMAILQVIEAYCQSNRVKMANATQLQPIRDIDKHIFGKLGDQSIAEDKQSINLSTIVDDVKSLKLQLESLNSWFKKERQSRKRLAAKVDSLASMIYK